MKRAMYRSIEKVVAMYNKNCTTIACSEGEYNQAKRINKNCQYVNNGINTEHIDKYLSINNYFNESKSDKIKVGAIGRIDVQKNPQMFNAIAEKFPDVEFVWIGDGKQRDLLKSENIKITGWLKNENAIEEIAKCDIFLLPSLWEGLPMSLLEAMYMGKICIASNISGNNNVIKNGVNGFICESFEDYCNTIDKVKNHEYNTEAISQRAKNSVVTEYNLDLMSDKYKKIYKQYEIK